ncbi:1-acyl-sn-glycerol-3-phosphate acyltransferase [Acetobacteraceae bacterium H6797]|nr:1-acyl-sn-glycerol-3-phosphate acyltransferase [Acetobacteraceae bacterium H6797]
MIFLRSLLFNAIFFSFTAVTMIVILPFGLVNAGFVRPAAGYWARAVVWLLRAICGIRLVVEGRQNLPAGPCVIASKHQSAFDTIIWFALVPGCTYVLKQELMRIPLYGMLARRMEMIPVDRAGGGSALKAMVRASMAALRKGRQIIIFPEGTRVDPGQTGRYQPGVVAIAHSMKGAPVIPVATNSGTCWGRRMLHKPPGTIALEILPALPTGLTKAEFMARLEGAIEPATKRLEDRFPAQA